MSPTNLIANTYNPHNQSPEELIDGFVVRTKEFGALYGDIKTDTMQHPPQHAIIQGRRGSGKTSFLLRIYYEVKRDESVNGWLLPIVFNEEQYAVRTLYKLWERIAEGLGSEYEAFLKLPDTMETHIEASDYEEICFDLLVAALQQHRKKLLLLIDNLGDMLQKFTGKEQHRLREVLITCADMKIIGASSIALESTFEYDKPFFEFFRIIDLPGLSKRETTALLLALGEKHGKEQIKKIIDEKPGKIEALRRLTDGVPRTMILLFEIFVDDAAGDSFKDLDMVLDRVTPLYKHRMDDLSAQQQEIVDIIALRWDALPVKEITRKSRMESKAVSAQLRLMEKNRIVIKKQTSTKNHLYQISERFFNIWYLMRYGRKKDKRVQWLTRFLEEWCSREELVERAERHLTAMKDGVVNDLCAYCMTEALLGTSLPPEMQIILRQVAGACLEKSGSKFLTLLSEPNLKLDKSILRYYDRKIKRQLELLCPNDKDDYFTGLYYQFLKENIQAEKFYKMAIKQGNVAAINNLALLYKNEFNDIDKAEKYFRIAIEKGNIHAMINYASLCKNEKNDNKEAEKYYRMAIDKGNPGAMYQLSELYEKVKKDIRQAEKYLKKACDGGNTKALLKMAVNCFLQRKNKNYALNCIKKAWNQGLEIDWQLYYPLILLWNDDIEQSTSIAKPLFEDPAILENEYPVKQYLLLLIAKRQYSFALRLFTESPLDLRDRYLPIYYALMYFMQDSHPDEYKKMGSELEETVMEIVQEIKTMAETM